MKKIKEITSIPKTLEEFLKVDTGDKNPIARAAFDVLDLPLPTGTECGMVIAKHIPGGFRVDSGDLVYGTCSTEADLIIIPGESTVKALSLAVKA